MPAQKTQGKTLNFDRTVNLGNILTIVVLIGAMFQMYSGIASRMDVMQAKVDMMWSAFKLNLDH